VLVGLFRFRSLKAIIYYYFFHLCALHCFDTVVWVQEEHPACKKLCDEVFVWLSAYGPADATDATASQNPIISCLI